MQQVRYKEPLLLVHHDGAKLSNASAQGGPAFRKAFPARGLAVADYNNDGRIDVLIGNNGGAPVLIKNNAGDGHHWIELKLPGTTCNRDWRHAHLVGRRKAAKPVQGQRWQLPVVP